MAQCNAWPGACDPRASLGVNPIVNDIWSQQMPVENNPLGGDTYNTQGYLSRSISRALDHQ